MSKVDRIMAAIRKLNPQESEELNRRLFQELNFESGLAWKELSADLLVQRRKRNRQPGPETVKRNELIAADRDRGFSIGALAKKYNLSKPYITQKVLQERGVTK